MVPHVPSTCVLDDHLVTAERAVAQSEMHVHRQQVLIQSMQGRSVNRSIAERLLKRFESTLKLQRENLALIERATKLLART